MDKLLKKCEEMLPKEIKPNEVEYLNAKNIGQNIMLEKCRKAIPAIIELVKREMREEVEKIKEEIPYVAFGNEELKNKPLAGDTAICPKCKKKHKIKYGTDKKTGEVTTMVGFVTCGENSYMVSLEGKLIN